MTREIPPVAASFKERPEDFEVTEIPAYLPSGEGEHHYLWIEKENLATTDLVRDLARACRISFEQIGTAGLKDARGRTRQWISVWGVDAAQLAAWEHPRARILEQTRHRNKLRIGHLRGNRFRIRLRDVDASREADVRRGLEMLASRGLPNFFGPQRFGMRQDNADVGRDILRQDYRTAAARIAGMPREEETGAVREARELFQAGRYAEAADLWPRDFRICHTLCRSMARTGGNEKKSVLGLGKSMIRFYLTALQSELFNLLLTRRFESLEQVETGDLAFKHDNGAVFRVENPEEEMPRAQRLEISPSGPLYGCTMTWPEGRPAEIERACLKESGLGEEDFSQRGWLRCEGARRPLRVPLAAPEVRSGRDDSGDWIDLAFDLPRGSYATAVLREIGKGQIVEKF